MSRIAAVFLMFLIFGCAPDKTINELSKQDQNTLIGFQRLPKSHVLEITDEKEPGEKLVLCITFVGKENKTPLANQLVRFYHTTASGNYEPVSPGDESTARLSGEATTNDIGKLYIETILPGNYANSGDNRHIHTTVFGASPETYDIHFKQYTGFMGTNFIKGSDQHFLVDLKKTKNNALVGLLTIEVKKPSSKN